MTLFGVLAVWLLLSVVTVALFSRLVRDARGGSGASVHRPEVALPQQRAHQDVRSTAMTGGRG